jgi:hypothetical protein
VPRAEHERTPGKPQGGVRMTDGWTRIRLEKGVNAPIDLSCLGRSQQESTRVRLTNSRGCELREALTFKPSLRLHVGRVLTKNGSYTHFVISGIGDL